MANEQKQRGELNMQCKYNRFITEIKTACLSAEH